MVVFWGRIASRGGPAASQRPQRSLRFEIGGKGTSIAGLVRAAQAKGLRADAYHSSIRHLKGLAGPAIFDFPEGHFCVFFGWKDGKALVLDPPAPNRAVSTTELAKRWGKHIIVFSLAESAGK